MIEIVKCKWLTPDLIRVEFIERGRRMAVNVNALSGAIDIKTRADIRPPEINDMIKQRALTFRENHSKLFKR